MADTIKECIEQQVRNFEYIGHPAMFERFVLRKGHEGISRPRPRNIAKKPDKECFKNASDWILSKNGKGWRYVEGIAMRPSLGMLIHHAWVENDEKHVLDLTWRHPEECLYYGVPFEEKKLVGEMLRSKVYGMLIQFDIYNAELMLAEDPELKDVCDRIISDRLAKRSRIHQIEGASA